MACICVNEPKRFLSGGSCLHHTAMTYSFVTQPASSTSYADYTRRRTYRRSRVTMSCAAGSQRFRNASSFSRAGIPHAGKLRAEIWHANVSENPFAHAADRTEYHSYFTLPSRFAATLLASAMPAPATARLGRLQLQGGGEATEGPNAMGSNVPTIEESGDDSGRSRWGPAVDPSMRFRDSPSTLVGSTLAADDHSEQRTLGDHIYESGVPSGGCRRACHPALRPGRRRRRSSCSSLAESTTGHYGPPMLTNAH